MAQEKGVGPCLVFAHAAFLLGSERGKYVQRLSLLSAAAIG